jgi:hypothetical protein
MGAACGADDGGGDSPTTTTVATLATTTDAPATTSATAEPTTSSTGPAETSTFRTEAARRCTDLLNALDHAVATAGQDARFDMLLASRQGETPTAEVVVGWRTALIARIDQLDALAAELSALTAPAADAEAWAVVATGGAHEIAVTTERLALLDLDWAMASASIEPDGGPSDEDLQALTHAQAALGMERRDCASVFSLPGNPPEHASFLTDASTACTTVVSRRLADDFPSDEIWDAILVSVEGGDVEPTPALSAAVDASLAEWRQTLADFEAVDTSDAPDPAQWEQLVALSADRVAGFERRQAVLATGSQFEINDAFTPEGVFRVFEAGDLDALGLDQRDCAVVGI